jgi:hypothetical protein
MSSTKKLHQLLSPALTKQHDYGITNILCINHNQDYHLIQYLNLVEIGGGQVDIYHNIKKDPHWEVSMVPNCVLLTMQLGLDPG